ncbi:hypothetical protein D3C78_1936780 [compost metagenome]
MGAFLILAGLMALAETLGFVSIEAKWGLPLAITCLGASLFWDAYKAKPANQTE